MNLNSPYLKAWLTFNRSPTDDAKLNNWQTFGNPTIGTANAFNGNALQLDGQSYLKLSGVELGGRDFYIDGWVYADSSSPDSARIIQIVSSSTNYTLLLVRRSSSNAKRIDFWRNSTADVSVDNGTTAVTTVNSVGTRVHFSLVYIHSRKFFRLFVNDGNSAGTSDSAVQYNRQSFDIYIGANKAGGQGLIGTIDELRIYDGTFLSSGYNTPPTLADYQNITCTFDTERKVVNAPLNWKYENYGTADLLTIEGTTLTDLTVSQSKTGSAFWQSTRAKCFDIPATKEIWLKFDVFTTLENRWRAYNENADGINGICSQTTGKISFFANTTTAIYNPANKVKNQLQSVLLHMISDSSGGVVEAWLDGVFVYRYTGNVNNGENFADIYLQSDGSGTFFSNVIISNTEITLNENISPLGHKLTWQFDIERIVKKSVSFDFDVERNLSGLMVVSFDVERKIIRTVDLLFNTERILNRSVDLYFDIARNIIVTVNRNFDVIRNLAQKLIMTPAENGVFTDETNSTGVQSIELNLAAQQITDRFSFTAINNAEIMQQVKGQFLDYQFDMRIERTITRGILKTCHCRSDIDQILFTQFNYNITADYIYYEIDVKSKTVHRNTGTYFAPPEEESEKNAVCKAHALTHLHHIARVIDKNLIALFDDFVSDMDITQEDVTYSDLLDNLLGWTARIPHMLINCYIRNDTLYVVQRGHEQNVIDLTNEKYTLPVVDESIVRTTWASLKRQEDQYTQYKHYYGWKIAVIPPRYSEDGKTEYTYKRIMPSGYLLTKAVTTNDDGSKVEVVYEYTMVKPFELTKETTFRYDASGNLEDKTETIHTHLTPSQQHTKTIDEEGNETGSVIGSHVAGFYDEYETLFEDTTESETGIASSFLVDTNFPVVDAPKKAELLQAIKWLNRKTQEILSFDLFDYPHIIDFNDRIILNGKTYFLESNTAVKTPRIVNKQSLTLVRWY